MSLELLGLGLVASLCGAVRAASTSFDVIYTHERRCRRASLSFHAGLGYGTDNLQRTNAW